MADSSTAGSSTLVGDDNNDDGIELRNKNQSLIDLLKSNQLTLVDSFKKNALHIEKEHNLFLRNQDDFRNSQLSSGSSCKVTVDSHRFPYFDTNRSDQKAQRVITTYTSTPRLGFSCLEDSGNIRTSSINRKSLIKTSADIADPINSCTGTRPTSENTTGKILPRKAKVPRHQVRFTSPHGLPQDSPRFITTNDRSQPSTSMLGYDWIASRLETDSIVEKSSEQYFEEIKDFRRAFRKECISSNENRENFPPSEDERMNDNEGAESRKCNGMYTINDRLCPVPIHGPNDNCQICKTKIESQSEYNGSYVRVSVPRSTLASPYKIRPHRRSSYNPSDTVALSEHCLAGWQHSHLSSSKRKDVLDLHSHTSNPNNTVNSKIGILSDTKPHHSRQTEDILDATLTLRHNAHLLSNRHHSNKHSSLAL